MLQRNKKYKYFLCVKFSLIIVVVTRREELSYLLSSPCWNERIRSYKTWPCQEPLALQLFDKGILTKLLVDQTLVHKHTLSPQGNTVDIGVSDMVDEEEFRITRGAMTVCLFSEAEQWQIWEIVATVMNLGNIDFQETEKQNLPVSYIGNKDVCRSVAEALKVYRTLVSFSYQQIPE